VKYNLSASCSPTRAQHTHTPSTHSTKQIVGNTRDIKGSLFGPAGPVFGIAVSYFSWYVVGSTRNARMLFVCTLNCTRMRGTFRLKSNSPTHTHAHIHLHTHAHHPFPLQRSMGAMMWYQKKVGVGSRSLRFGQARVATQVRSASHFALPCDNVISGCALNGVQL
jgi:hypothetical protein